METQRRHVTVCKGCGQVKVLLHKRWEVTSLSLAALNGVYDLLSVKYEACNGCLAKNTQNLIASKSQ